MAKWLGVGYEGSGVQGFGVTPKLLLVLAVVNGELHLELLGVARGSGVLIRVQVRSKLRQRAYRLKVDESSTFVDDYFADDSVNFWNVNFWEVNFWGGVAERALRPHQSPSPLQTAPARSPPERARFRVVHFGTVVDSRTTPSQKCEAVPRRAHI